jgi:ABC-type Co2+ transport system permease subunit
MHIETGIVNGAKIALSFVTAGVSFGFIANYFFKNFKLSELVSVVVKSILASLAVFCFFEVFPHYPVGVSEVHLILGSTLFLVFGLVPTAIGLSVGLLIQGIFFAPFDLPQYFINVTTLLVPLISMSYLSKKIIPSNIAYKDISYAQALKLSAIYQGGIVSLVAFWALYGQGFGSENLVAVSTFGLAYLSVIILEPFIDLAVLAGVKSIAKLQNSSLINKRVFITNETI